LYFPLRQWLWQRLVNTNVVRLETLLPQMSELPFVANLEEREKHWDALLRRMFDPLDIRRGDEIGQVAKVRDNGLEMSIPPIGDMQSRVLRFAGSGRRLFSSRDAEFATTLRHLAEQVMSGREGYERGVQQERQRLARDLHDNIGARLLRLIHHLRGTPDAEIARDAMKDLRSAISAIDAPPAPLKDALADWRAEAEGRCEAAHIQLSWQQSEMPQLRLQPRIKAALGSVLREAVTNALKHASPASVSIRIGSDESTLSMEVMNDGNISDPAQWQEGYGLRSIRGRLHDLGGQLILSREDSAVHLKMNIPLARLSS
jgi:signal transduction histidine kinase